LRPLSRAPCSGGRHRRQGSAHIGGRDPCGLDRVVNIPDGSQGSAAHRIHGDGGEAHFGYFWPTNDNAAVRTNGTVLFFHTTILRSLGGQSSVSSPPARRPGWRQRGIADAKAITADLGKTTSGVSSADQATQIAKPFPPTRPASRPSPSQHRISSANTSRRRAASPGQATGQLPAHNTGRGLVVETVETTW
jgi:hypothetical protein